MACILVSPAIPSRQSNVGTATHDLYPARVPTAHSAPLPSLFRCPPYHRFVADIAHPPAVTLSADPRYPIATPTRRLELRSHALHRARAQQ
ncbi:hypothetical protein VTN02DRAFT_1870 [Thermoascus thermophilus]